MDASGFQPEHYYLGKPFFMPSPTGGKNAIAIKTSQVLMVVSAYTILVGGAFLAWWIIIMKSIPMVAPRKHRTKPMIMLITSFQTPDPIQTLFLTTKTCVRLIKTSRRKTESESGYCNYNENPKHPRSQCGLPETDSSGPRSISRTTGYGVDLCVGLVVIILALGTVMGGIVAGISLPELMVIGHVAPVNEKMVLRHQPAGAYRSIYGAALNRVAPLRALSIVDSGSVTSELEEKVWVEKVALNSTSRSVDNSYEIKYGFKIHGYEFGLQKLQDLAVHVNGSCSFRPQWYEGLINDTATGKPMDQYTLYKGEGWYDGEDYPWFKGEYKVDLTQDTRGGLKIRSWDTEQVIFDEDYSDADLLSLTGHVRNDSWPQMRYSIIPGTQRREQTEFEPNVTDPWYVANNDTYGRGEIRLGRPPLDCNETMGWYYRGSYLRRSLSEFPAGISRSLLSTERAFHRVQAATPGVNIPPAIYKIIMWRFTSPLVVAMLQELTYGRLESSMRAKGAFSDLRGASAYADMKRLILSGYILGRNVFRESALMYTNPMLADDIKNQNMLRDEQGEPLPDTGDFVVPSESITTLRLEFVIGVPAVVGLSWVLVFVVLAFVWRRSKRSYTGVVVETLVQ